MDKTLTYLGKRSKKVLLFGGVYSNLQALETLMQVAKTQNIAPDHCICTGDIVGYCAQPEATVQLFKTWQALSIAGNVEVQLSEGANNCGCDFKEGSRCDTLSQQWYPYAQSKLSQNSLAFLSALSQFITFEFAGNICTVVHGSYFNISEFIFKSTPWERKHANFVATQSNVIIAGHCGLPFKHEKNGDVWVNPGVIGMPANNGNPKVWYAILEDNNGSINVSHHQLKYNHTKASQLMEANALPSAYAKTLITGLWDNTDILPETEAKQQGLPIYL